MLNEKMVKTLFAIVTPPVIVKCAPHSHLLKAPTNLQSFINEVSIKLNWDFEKDEEILAYNVYRAAVDISGNSPDGSAIKFMKLDSVLPKHFFDAIEEFNSDHIFIYYVTAVYLDGKESGPSNYIKVIKDGYKVNIVKGSLQN